MFITSELKSLSPAGFFFFFFTVMHISVLDTCGFQFAPFLWADREHKKNGWEPLGTPWWRKGCWSCGGDLTCPMWLGSLVRSFKKCLKRELKVSVHLVLTLSRYFYLPLILFGSISCLWVEVSWSFCYASYPKSIIYDF